MMISSWFFDIGWFMWLQCDVSLNTFLVVVGSLVAVLLSQSLDDELDT